MHFRKTVIAAVCCINRKGKLAILRVVVTWIKGDSDLWGRKDVDRSKDNPVVK